jgi:hypothetical protein
MFRLDWKNRRWHSLEEPEEADFPLIIVVDGKRYEFYSDGTFDEKESEATPRRMEITISKETTRNPWPWELDELTQKRFLRYPPPTPVDERVALPAS